MSSEVGNSNDATVETTQEGLAWARAGYRVLSWGLLACIAIQVFLAGMAVFGGPANWVMHRGFVPVLSTLPLVMFPLAFLGRLPNLQRWLPLGLIFLIGLQAALIQFGTLVAALHAVNALLIFWVALILARGSSMKRKPVAAG